MKLFKYDHIKLRLSALRSAPFDLLIVVLRLYALYDLDDLDNLGRISRASYTQTQTIYFQLKLVRLQRLKISFESRYKTTA